MNTNVRRAGRRAWAVVLLLALSLVPMVTSAASAQEATPERVAAAVARMDAVVEQAMQQSGVPGVAVAVVYKDQVVYLKGFGVREAGMEARVDADTVFQLASVSKPVASTVIASLVGDGRFSWDDPIVKHDPSFAMHDPWVTSQVTARDMFSHRSGLPDHVGDLLEDIGYNREQALHRLRYVPLGDRFRAEYAYTNFGLTEGAVAAAKAAGMSWEDLSAELLYRPLGMTSTSSRFADYAAAPNRALTHVLVDGRQVAKYTRDADAQSPAGGVSSSARDMAQWLRLHLGYGTVDGREIIDGEALVETHRPQMIRQQAAYPATGRAGFYGLGWNVSYDDHGRLQLSHSGGFALGAGTAAYLVPEEEIGIVVLTNAEPRGTAEALALSFLDLALTGTVERDYVTLLRPFFDAQLGPTYGTTVDYSSPLANPGAPLALSAYTGTYENDYWGDIEVAEADGGLVLRVGPNKMQFTMRHWNRDTFLFQPTGENAYGPSGVMFEIGPNGRAASVTIEYFNIDDQGTFTRSQEAQP
jgi:CubicO group peptidase (beta-lactamase class C family)